MSSSILTIIQTQINLYGYSILLILGNIGNVFIVILFSRQQQNACSIYLLSLAIMNNVYLIFNSLVEIFPFYYFDETIRAFVLCKLRIYLANVLGEIARTILVLACIDRFMITSNRASFRAFSTTKRAKYIIFFSIIFWSLFASHILVMATIINGRCHAFGIYLTVYTIYTTIFIGLIPPIMMSIFGYLSYRNMRQIHVRVQPVTRNINDANMTLRQRDRDLLTLVISEICVYVLTTTTYTLILLEMMISEYIIPNKSVQYLQIENFIFNITLLLLHANSAAPFYIYIISSKSFRHDFKQLFINGYRKLRRQPTVPVPFRTNQILTQRDNRV